MPIRNRGVEDAAPRVQQRQMTAIGNGHSEPEPGERVYRHCGVNARGQLLQPGPCDR